MNGRNEGIQNSGTISARNIAAGRGAHAGDVVAAAPPDPERNEIARRLDVLLRELDAHGHKLERGDEVRESAEAVADELQKDKPNSVTVTGILAGIGSSVASVASLSTAVSALLESVQGFL
jgi:hypothetical protein